MFNIAFDSLEYLFRLKEKGYSLKQNIRIPKKELKDIYKDEERTLDKNILFSQTIDLTPKKNEYLLEGEKEEKEVSFGDYSSIMDNVEVDLDNEEEEETEYDPYY
jgi:hypothetical protein